jgi:23S rRNA (guanosine2251-2'-O)-methyltransferase
VLDRRPGVGRAVARPALSRHGPGGPKTEVVSATFIYGRNPVYEALRGRRRVRDVVVVDGRVGDELEQHVTDWGRGAGRRPPIRRLPTAELSALLGTADHQGIGAEVDPYVYVDLEAVLATQSMLVALDEVQDPHNLGAIIRTAEAAGAAVLVPRHRAAEVTPAVVKASAGATEHATVCRVRNLADALAEAKKAGFWIYGSAADAAGLYTAQDYRYPTCFVVGSEGQGLGRRVASMCDVMVSLPLEGKMESLNVGVSAGILLYEAVRQRTV